MTPFTEERLSAIDPSHGPSFVDRASVMSTTVCVFTESRTATSRNGESDRNVNQVEIVSHLENYMSDTDILRASTAPGVAFSIRFTFYLTHRYGK